MVQRCRGLRPAGIASAFACHGSRTEFGRASVGCRGRSVTPTRCRTAGAVGSCRHDLHCRSVGIDLRLPLPSYVPWIVVAAIGAGTVLSYAILAEYFPTELAGRANAALNLFHIGGAFVVQYVTGLVVQLWAPTDGHYPEIAYQTAFAFNVSLQIAATIWFARTWVLTPLPRSNMRHPAFAENSSFLRPAFVRQNSGRRLRRYVYRACSDILLLWPPCGCVLIDRA